MRLILIDSLLAPGIAISCANLPTWPAELANYFIEGVGAWSLS